MKVNPFGLFVKLDEEIHGLAHISLLNIAAKDKITDLYKADEIRDFEIVSISPSEHRLGLKLAGDAKAKSVEDGEEKPKKATKTKKSADSEETVDEAAAEEVKKDKKEKKVKAEKK